MYRGKETLVPSDQELVDILFNSGIRQGRINPVRTTNGKAAFGIFPDFLDWNGNFFCVYAASLVDDKLTTSSFFTGNDGRIFSSREPLIEVFSFLVGGKINEEEGLSYFSHNWTQEERNKRVTVKTALQRLSQSGSHYDPSQSVKARGHLIRILINQPDLGDRDISEAARNIIAMRSAL